MDIWIDTATGTWGDAASLVIIKGAAPGVIESLEDASDSEICALGKAYKAVQEGEES